jgi:CRP/FNR family transcriptional regulator, cyclic AMP receptor protein
MAAPYNLELTENCANCAWRSEGFFCDLPGAALKAFEAAKYTSSYPAGAVLFVEGQVPRGAYLLCKGRVKLAMTSAEGKAIILRIAEPGELIGVNSAIAGQPYEVTAEALEPCQINFIKRDAFLRLMREHQEACVNVTEQLSNDYSAACVQIRSLGLSRTAAEKVARFLLEWSAKGRETNQGIRVNLPLTHEEIAQIVGVSRETVTRTLTDLKHKSLITMTGPMVVIRDKTALESLAAA